MAFDPSKLVSVLAPAAGALAAPGDPRLGATIGSGLASAIFPTQAERDDAEFSKLRLSSVKQQIAFNEEDQATKRRLLAESEKKLPELESRAKKQYDLGVKSAELGIQGQELNLANAQRDNAMRRLAPFAKGGSDKFDAEFDTSVRQIFGQAYDPKISQALSSHPAVETARKMQSFFSTVEGMNIDSEEEREAVRQHAALAGIVADFEGNDLVLKDIFDGTTITPSEMKQAKEQANLIIREELVSQKAIKAMSTNPMAAMFGPSTSKLAQAFLDDEDEMAFTKAQNASESVGKMFQPEVLHAAGGANVLSLHQGNPAMQQEMMDQYNENYQASGFFASLGVTGTPTLRISKAHPWAEKSMAALKGTQGFSEDQLNITIPAAAMSTIVGQQFEAEISRFTPAPDPITKNYNKLIVQPGFIDVPVLDEYGNIQKGEDGKPQMKREILGSWAMQDFMNNYRTYLGKDQGVNAKELREFMKTPTGKAMMQHTIDRAMGYSATAEATERKQAKSQLDLLNEKMAETRQQAIGKPRGGLLATALEGIGTAVPFNSDSQALSAIATDQAAKREAAGGESSSLLRNIARKQVEIDNPPYEQLDGRGM